jgi:hypothetical protein
VETKLNQRVGESAGTELAKVPFVRFFFGEEVGRRVRLAPRSGGAQAAGNPAIPGGALQEVVKVESRSSTAHGSRL